MRLLPKKSFKKKDTIKNKQEIKNVIYSGEKIKSHHIDIFYLYGKKEKMAVLLNRQIKKAHERNTIKRRIRDIYRKLEKNKKKELLIRIKGNPIKLHYQDIKKEIESMIHSIDRKKERTM